MSNEKKINTTEVIIIPNEEIYGNLEVFSSECVCEYNWLKELQQFIKKHRNTIPNFENILLGRCFSSDELVSYIVDEGFTVMLYSGVDNQLDLYFPDVNDKPMSINQLFIFNMELKKKANVELFLAHYWNNEEKAFRYDDLASCHLNIVATNSMPKKLLRIPRRKQITKEEA